MNAADLIEHLTELDVVLAVNGNRLDIDAPTGVVTPDLMAAIKQHKPTIIDMLAGPPESDIRRAWVFRDCNRRMRAALGQEK